jgi:hypothetical protein
MAGFDTSLYLALGAMGFVIILFSLILGTLLNSLALWITSKLFKLANTTFKTALVAALVAVVIAFVINFVISLGTAGNISLALIGSLVSIVAVFVINSLVVKKFYELETGKAFLVGLVWTVMGLIVGFIVGLTILFASAILFASLGSTLI